MSMLTAKEHDVVFNLWSLKYQLLTPGLKCDKCQQESTDWMLISTCHDKICPECLDFKATGDLPCPGCNTMFNKEKNTVTSTKMKQILTYLEKMIYYAKVMEYGTSEELDLNNEILNRNLLDMCIELNGHLQEDCINGMLLGSNCSSQESINLTSSVKKSQLLDKVKNKTIAEKQATDNINVSKQSTNLESSRLNILNLNDSSMIGISKDIQHQFCPINDTDMIISSSESEDGIIEGTPDKCNVLDPESSSSSFMEQKCRQIVFTYTNLETDSDLDVLRNLAKFPNIIAQSAWTDTVTHLIVKLLPDGSCVRTKKFTNALLSHCYIVTFDWAKECLSSKSIVPEMNYMPNDISGEPSPLVSWQVGKGIIDSPMKWTRNCLLFFHSSIEFNETCLDVIEWACKAGFAVTNKMEEFNKNKFKMRFILVDQPNIIDDENTELPNDTDILGWMRDYKAVTIFLDWFLECLFCYRFVIVSPKFHFMALKSNMVTEFTLMDKSLFTFDH